MAYAICRIQKLKASNLRVSAQHNTRQRFTPNANPDKPYVCIIGGEEVELDALVRERIGKQTIRKNAVMAVEILLSASPEYFRPLDPSEAGYWEQDKLDNFVTATQAWLTYKYGDRLVQAYLHLDEATPHIHAYLVPLDEKGKLNCRGLFGQRWQLSQLQDSYAQALEHLGIERGIKGSRATHTQISQYYTAVTQAPDLSLDEQGIAHQLADRKRILKENRELKSTVKALAKQVEIRDKSLVQMEVGREALTERLKYWQHKYQKLTSTSTLSMQTIARELGLVPIDTQNNQWSNHQHTLTITDTSFCLVSSISTNATSLSSFLTAKERVNPLELVMLINDCNSEDAALWLCDRYGEGEAIAMANDHLKEIIKNTSMGKVPQFTPPESDENLWYKLRTYLVEERKLQPQLLDQLHREGMIYADKQQNLVGLCRNLNSTNIKGATVTGTKTSNSFTSLAPNSKRSQGYFFFECGGKESLAASPLPKVVLTDTPLDALAKATLDNSLNSRRRTIYLSLSSSQPPWEFLQRRPKASVLIALNKQAGSEKLAHQIRQRLPKQTVFQPPNSIDWISELENVSRWQQPEFKHSQSILARNFNRPKI
jgi:Plasmid recombination enzyme/Protein of unknown function (DUF3991)